MSVLFLEKQWYLIVNSHSPNATFYVTAMVVEMVGGE